MRSGFVAVAGRPNVGKSTLVNALCGGKVAIVSDKPQTTRRRIFGIATTDDSQLVLADLPGFQRPRDPLTEHMQRTVDASFEDVDAVLFVVDARERIGAGDRFIAQRVFGLGAPVVIAVNKIDRLKPGHVASQMQTAAALAASAVGKAAGTRPETGASGALAASAAGKAAGTRPETGAFGALAASAAGKAAGTRPDGASGAMGDFHALHPVSAKTGDGVDELRDELVGLLPEGPLYFPPEQRTDLPLEIQIAELVREQALALTREEVPHAISVEVEEIEDKVVRAILAVETESQKQILVGKGGSMVRQIGMRARPEIELLLGGKIFLDLQVKVRPRWRRDEAMLERLGI